MAWPWTFATLPAGNVAASKLDDNFNAAAQLDSPAFTGTPTTTNATQAVNSSQIANTAYVDRVAVQQVVRTTSSTFTAGTGAVIPLDNTIPQNTEGDEYLSVTITPKSASSTLRIDVLFNCCNTYGGIQSFTVALFQDSTANALTANYCTSAGQYFGYNVPITYYMTSGTTSATTFKIRAGTQSSGVINMNGGGVALYGGVFGPSSITVTEYFV